MYCVGDGWNRVPLALIAKLGCVNVYSKSAFAVHGKISAQLGLYFNEVKYHVPRSRSSEVNMWKLLLLFFFKFGSPLES